MKKKIDLSELSVENNTQATRYYGCVNCGHHGDFGKVRKRKLYCEECGYDDITPFDIDEWKAYHKERQRMKDWLDGKLEKWSYE